MKKLYLACSIPMLTSAGGLIAEAGSRDVAPRTVGRNPEHEPRRSVPNLDPAMAQPLGIRHKPGALDQCRCKPLPSHSARLQIVATSVPAKTQYSPNQESGEGHTRDTFRRFKSVSLS